jgi:hypothetical protein
MIPLCLRCLHFLPPDVSVYGGEGDAGNGFIAWKNRCALQAGTDSRLLLGESEAVGRR